MSGLFFSKENESSSEESDGDEYDNDEIRCTNMDPALAKLM